MSTQIEHIQGAEAESPLSIFVQPDPVDAGAELTLWASAEFASGDDIAGQTLTFLDHEGGEIGRLEFLSCEEGINRTGDIVVEAPLEAGEYAWTAVLSHGGEEITAAFAIEVAAHKTTLLVWDVPATLAAGEEAIVRVGLKCSCNCDHAGTEVAIRDARGRMQGTAMIGDDIWPGTEAMYFGEATLRVKGEAGLHKWTAEVAPSADAPPHQGTSTRFSVRVVPPPECRVTIEAFSNDGQTPIAGASVVLHPYRGVTDAEGIAAFMVPKGSYRVLVSKARHEAVSLPLDVEGDTTTRARLALEPPEDPDAHYI